MLIPIVVKDPTTKAASHIISTVLNVKLGMLNPISDLSKLVVNE